jgi:hypothetical protein
MATNAILSPPFLVGANLPWVHYGIDFGANAWRPDGGVAQPDECSQLDATFARLAEAGTRYVRWFLFCDGRAGIRFSQGGHPEGLDEFVFRDIDLASATARRHGLQLMFVLLDFIWCDPARIVKGVQLGGRSQVLRDPDHCHALLDTVFGPVLERYGREPAIFAWDIINEPEWIKTLTSDHLRSFLAGAVSLVHSRTVHPVTVGSAAVKWRDLYTGLGLDFYQVHWYDSLRHQPSLETPVAELGFDRPVLLGEFPTRGSRRTASNIVETARAAGYAGAFYWSALAKDRCSA